MKIVIIILLLVIIYLVCLLVNWSERMKRQQTEIEALRAALRSGGKEECQTTEAKSRLTGKDT